MRGFFFKILIDLFQAQAGISEPRIDKPAGALPRGDDFKDRPAEFVGDETEGVLIDGGSSQKLDAAEKKGKNQQLKKLDLIDDAEESSATEITKGVRIEDIVEPPSEYRYAAFSKGDPFVPPIMTEEKKLISPLEIPIISPLQKFKLQELSLVGIWQLSNGDKKGLIMTPGSNEGGTQGIIVKAGDAIGQKGGRILSMGDDFLTIREFSLAPDGNRQYQDTQMYMGSKRQEEIAGKIRFEAGAKEPKVLIEKKNEAPNNQGGAAPANLENGAKALPENLALPQNQDKAPPQDPAVEKPKEEAKKLEEKPNPAPEGPVDEPFSDGAKVF